ncbi:DNA polymerase III subunit gamma/tau [Patescibacteria group bacterium]|nr:DNA polymerase III subunit gamma/tau [Patescibacteria group bacterium]
MSLYRKYRPQTFSHLVGQNHVNRTILNAVKLGRVSHAYLFTGPRGTGKTSTARLLAKAINCLNVSEGEPCNKCEICLEIAEGRLIDIIEIDAASNRGIDEIRDLREKINFAPTRAKSKVYIIDEVHMLTKEAFNALLKTLEEPPSHVYFVLATTEVHKIPETILSRCQRFDFKRIDETVLLERLKFIAGEENISAEEKALEVIVHHAEGGMRDAIGLMEQITVDGGLSYENVCTVLGVGGFESIEKLYGLIESGSAGEALDELSGFYSAGHELAYFNKRFLEYLRKRMLKSVEENRPADTARILKFIEFFHAAYTHARSATIPQLPLEIAIIRSCEVVSGRVEALAGGSSVRDEGAVPVNADKPASERPHQSLAPRKEEDIKSDVAPALRGVHVNTSAEPTAEKKSPELESIKKKWRKIAEIIRSPIARRSFQQAEPVKLEGGVLTLVFASKFHMDKIMETMNRTDAERAIEETLGAHLKIDGEVRAFEQKVSNETVRALPEEGSDVATEPINKAEAAAQPNDLAAQVISMFEGEMA